MRWILWVGLVFSATGMVSGTISAQTVLKDVVYTTDSAGAQHGDVYEPQGDGPFPAMVFLHGGSWRSGDKREFARLGMDLAKQGYAGFSIDYDLKPGSFPTSWEEARSAVRFVRNYAAEYHVDPKRIVIAGTSAGGELAALVALAPQGPTAQQDGDVPVAGAVILNGVYDLCFPARVIKRYMGGTCASMKDAYADASPVHDVHEGAPPFFVGHGTKDWVVPYIAAQMFVEDLQKGHVAVTPFIATGGGHMYWRKKKYYDANLAAVVRFLRTTVP